MPPRSADKRRWVIAVALLQTFIPVAKHKDGGKTLSSENETHKADVIYLITSLTGFVFIRLQPLL